MNTIGTIKNKNILFLQGPVGFFFKKLDNLFHKNGANTYRIGFNAGDSFFSNTYNYTPYRGTPDDWQEFIFLFLKEKKTVASPKNSTPNSLSNWAIVIAYYFIANLLRFRYPNYRHHRNFSAIEEFFYGSKSLIRKVIYSFRDKKYAPLIEGELHKKYFFVPLQTHNDFQILQHSNYGSIEKFITEVLESFAKQTQDETKLIFKHHPEDRGRKNYSRFIYDQAKELGIKNKILVFHDVHLPTCLQNAIGTVTINSTVGLSSIHHETPTITLGNAIYDVEGLTCKGMELDDFWHSYKQPDMLLYKKYRNYIISETQLKGSFYGMLPVFDFEK